METKRAQAQVRSRAAQRLLVIGTGEVTKPLGTEMGFEGPKSGSSSARTIRSFMSMDMALKQLMVFPLCQSSLIQLTTFESRLDTSGENERQTARKRATLVQWSRSPMRFRVSEVFSIQINFHSERMETVSATPIGFPTQGVHGLCHT